MVACELSIVPVPVRSSEKCFSSCHGVAAEPLIHIHVDVTITYSITPF